MLELQSLCLALGGRPVLRDITLHLARGEFVSILGPSGAGKSTLLRLLIGAETADAGTIRLDGKPLQGRPFAFMPQHDALMPWRRILDNATLGLEVRGLSRSAARAAVRPHFAEFGLTGYEDHWPSQLSGGMRQRAALLRTVVQGSDFLLLDEPFGALDALTRAQMQLWLQAMWARHRWSALLITHDVREAVLLSDRIYLLSPRPASVLREIAVPLPRPRGPETQNHPAARAIEADILTTLLAMKGPTP